MKIAWVVLDTDAQRDGAIRAGAGLITGVVEFQRPKVAKTGSSGSAWRSLRAGCGSSAQTAGDGCQKTTTGERLLGYDDGWGTGTKF